MAKTEFEKMVMGEMYNPADPLLMQMRQRARSLCDEFNQITTQHKNNRLAILQQLLGKVGQIINMTPNIRFDYGCNTYIGENFYANFDCCILDVAPVQIGNNCMLGPNVGIYTATHPLDPVERNSGYEYAKPITIGDNCWIGGGAIITPGVILGNNVVVGAGAVVTKSFGDNVVLGGNPAKIIKHIEIKK